MALLRIGISTIHVKARARDEDGRLLNNAHSPTSTNRLTGGMEYAVEVLKLSVQPGERDGIESSGMTSVAEARRAHSGPGSRRTRQTRRCGPSPTPSE